jgi:hypothetical protein
MYTAADYRRHNGYTQRGGFAERGKHISHAKPQRTRRGLNSVAEETLSGEGMEKPLQAFSFAFFAASREENLL